VPEYSRNLRVTNLFMEVGFLQARHVAF